MTRLLQLQNSAGTRFAALVENDGLRLLAGVESVSTLCQKALTTGEPLEVLAKAAAGPEAIPYDDAYLGRGWSIMPCFDHPAEPARCIVSGTGLTHRASVDNRNTMHQAKTTVTDSMRMYQWGLEGGIPAPGTIGVSPEWFYKGNGTCLRGHGDSLTVPAFSEDGGDESEIAGIYIIDSHGQPRRVGMAQGNEFSDHILEKKNYLYLASCKLRECSIGPELILNPGFHSVPGVARVRRAETVLWEKAIQSGEANMCHSLENIEHHHFKFPLHRRPGDVHVHFFGASGFSFGDQMRLTNGDVMEVSFEGFGRPLRNPVAVEAGPAKLMKVVPL
jgi:hypothetical protein